MSHWHAAVKVEGAKHFVSVAAESFVAAVAKVHEVFSVGVWRGQVVVVGVVQA